MEFQLPHISEDNQSQTFNLLFFFINYLFNSSKLKLFLAIPLQHTLQWSLTLLLQLNLKALQFYNKVFPRTVKQ